MGSARSTILTADRTDVDHACAFAFFEQIKAALGAQEGAFQVYGHDAVPFFRGDLVKILRIIDSGIVDQNIKPAFIGGDVGNNGVNGISIADFKLQDARFAAVFGNFCCGLIWALSRSLTHVRITCAPSASQLVADGFADSPASAGD